MTNRNTVALWEAASEWFAQGASGTVKVLLGDNPGRIWSTIELPALIANAQIDQIIAVDPETLTETILFAR